MPVIGLECGLSTSADALGRGRALCLSSRASAVVLPNCVFEPGPQGPGVLCSRHAPDRRPLSVVDGRNKWRLDKIRSRQIATDK